MKKILKTTCAALLLASSVCSVAGVANRQVSAQTPGAVYSTVNKKGEYLDQVKIANYKKEVDLGSNYALPTATMAGATLKSTEVLYNGKTVQIIDGAVSVDYIGTYTIKYTFEKDSTEYVTPVTFRAVKADLYLSDVASSIPLKLPTVLEDGVSVKLPTPEVTNKDGEEVTATVKTKVVAPGNIELTVTDGIVDFTDAKDTEGELAQGNYYITYTAEIGGVKLAESKAYSFEVIKDYEITELRFDYVSAKPTTWELGTEKELPKVAGVDRKTASESETVNVEYEVKKIVFTKDGQKSDVTLSDVLDGMKFKPNKIGTYTISYEVKDFLGNISEYQNDLVIEVKDTKAPDIKIVEGYEVGATTHTDALHKLPSKTVAENVVIMPMWAEDESELKTMSIAVEDRTTYSYVYQTSEHDDVVNKELVFNKTAEFTLGALQVDTGVNLVNGRTYRVYYNATDEHGNAAPAAYYDIKVDNNLVYENPTVDFNEILPSNAVNGDVIEFSAPSFADANDERLLEKVEYAYGSDAYQSLEADEDGMYRLTVDTEEKTLSIRISAENNGGLVGEKTHVINIDDIDDDEVPVVTNSGLLAEEYKQNDLVVLPTITVADKYIQSISAKVEHIDEYGKETEVFANVATIKLTDTEKQLTGSFTPAKAGTYRVRYTVADKGNYLVIQDFVFYVNEDPELVDRRFSNLPVTINEGKAEVGETVKLPNATIIAGQGEATSHYVKVEGPSGSAEITNDKFVPYAVGTYKLQYVGKAVGKAGTYDIYSQVYTIEVKDTKAPTYYLNETVNRTADKGDVLTIPMISVDDGEYGVGVNFKDSYVSVTSKNSIPVKYSLEELYESAKTTTLSYEEEYTLTYYIVDNAGNEAETLKYSIAVGDVSNPTIELEEDIIPATIKKGVPFTIDLADIDIDDIDDKTMTVENNVTIKLWNTTLNKEEKPVSEQGAGKYTFDIKNAGSYEFTFTVTDRAGHSTEVKKTFVIDAESNNGAEKTEVIGTILIVVSVLALVGVILYFILSKKKNDRIYKNK